MKLEVAYYDNRGTNDVAYGFVYFSDDSRVLYASGKTIRPYKGPCWTPATMRHVEIARDFLSRQGIQVP